MESLDDTGMFPINCTSEVSVELMIVLSVPGKLAIGVALSEELICVESVEVSVLLNDADSVEVIWVESVLVNATWAKVP